MKFTLYTQKPKAKEIGLGNLDVSREGRAGFYKDITLLAEMARVRLEFIGADGIMLSGMESDGFAKNGTQKFKYQEWWLRYIIEE